MSTDADHFDTYDPTVFRLVRLDEPEPPKKCKVSLIDPQGRTLIQYWVSLQQTGLVADFDPMTVAGLTVEPR